MDDIARGVARAKQPRRRPRGEPFHQQDRRRHEHAEHEDEGEEVDRLGLADGEEHRLSADGDVNPRRQGDGGKREDVQARCWKRRGFIAPGPPARRRRRRRSTVSSPETSMRKTSMRFFPGRNAPSGTTACQAFSRPGARIVRVVAQTVPLTAIARSKGKAWSPSGAMRPTRKQGSSGSSGRTSS